MKSCATPRYGRLLRPETTSYMHPTKPQRACRQSSAPMPLLSSRSPSQGRMASQHCSKFHEMIQFTNGQLMRVFENKGENETKSGWAHMMTCDWGALERSSSSCLSCVFPALARDRRGAAESLSVSRSRSCALGSRRMSRAACLPP